MPIDAIWGSLWLRMCVLGSQAHSLGRTHALRAHGCGGAKSCSKNRDIGVFQLQGFESRCKMCAFCCFVCSIIGTSLLWALFRHPRAGNAIGGSNQIKKDAANGRKTGCLTITGVPKISKRKWSDFGRFWVEGSKMMILP